MANPPYSGSVIILRENADGFTIDLFHWPDIPEGTPIPPRGNIIAALTARADADGIIFNHEQRTAATRANLIAKFTGFVNSRFPDTP